MFKSLLRYFISILVISLSLTSILSVILISNQYLNQTKTQMERTLKLCDYSIDYNGDLHKEIQSIKPLIYQSNSRLTIINLKGEVVADTYKKDIKENHLDREEVQEAKNNSNHLGYAIRVSDTTNSRLLYAAYYHNGYYLRLAISYNGIKEYFPSIIPALVVSGIISFVISYILALIFARRLSEPLYEISDGLAHMSDDYRFELKEYDYLEYKTIVHTIQSLSHRLRKAKRETKFEQAKIDEILKRMREGFILLDENNTVLSINESAIRIFGELKEKDSIESKVSYDMIKALESKETHERIEIKHKGEYYRVYISKLPFGKAIFMVDITAMKNARKVREEFFSSVSHELKTPITSIRGYSELLVANVIQDKEKQNDVLKKIQNQVRNMDNLINDILMLSRLDSNDILEEKVPIKMKPLLEKVINDYEGMTLEKNVTIEKHIEDIVFIGNVKQISTLASNLISNAIKYNKQDGKIEIILKKEANQLCFIVSDTGIGIPEASKHRVFERFYRVDKGRSRQMGGTGLGLAIVKHIVAYYKGKIKLSSKLNEGTTITIYLPLGKEK